ncbi:MAG: hypothetical protein WA901_06555 [Phormidesmis sp.]
MALRSISSATQFPTRAASATLPTMLKTVISAAVLAGIVSGTAYAQVITSPEVSPEVSPEASTEEAQAAESIEPPAAPTPKPTPFSPNLAGITDLSTTETAGSGLGIGHLRPQPTAATEAGDGVSWLESAILPLYSSPGGDHWGWIYQGWLIPGEQAYLAIGRDAGFAMVKSDDNLYTFPVLEVREDGWFRMQYTTGGTAWAHTSQLSLGETPLVIETWAERLASQASVYFLDRGNAQPLRSRPELANNMLSLVSADSLIEPLDIAGDWMRVRVTRPVAECTPLTGATTTEGWMRWRQEAGAALVWYRPDQSC